jgi:hypothetical protein
MVGESRKVPLRSGGTLSVKLDGVQWMSFDDDERAFMDAIVDAMHAYERKWKPPVADVPRTEPEAGKD